MDFRTFNLCVLLLLFAAISEITGQRPRSRAKDDRRGGRPTERERGGIFNGAGPRSHRTCDESSCYPATGNLLIGREDKLWASSTCGMKKVERYCIVSHLKERKKCFYCNSRPEHKGNIRLHHGIENIVSRIGESKKKPWWQSENGVENVTIQFDLEAEFHFTHLIITFKTFRPAAMLIERSHDFGQTWRVYQYFAYDCAESFPGVPIGPRRQIADVVCDSHYSGVEPSSGGEVIFRVLPPNIHIDDPYSPEVQNLLKMTNLRINFTKLHTLGDNLLDSRKEIQEKYYYAIYDMVIRGSCSCYGHASRCIADPGQPTRPDMVYGRCECTHNTKGLNCEQCEDFYHDQPWRPAIGSETNACKRCICNDHATRCHFDPAVWELTKRQSGGVCDDCQHNTMGRNCEECKPFFYQDPGRDLKDPNICQPCDCDPRGSLDDGICDSKTDPLAGLVAGRCYCKRNVEGRRCDRCKNGYWNFRSDNPDGCDACTCNSLGTAGDQGCNVYTGECLCKRNVVGRDCNQCLPQYYGLSAEEEGCKACDCDPGGSYDNNCDVITGQCRCRAHVDGRRCDQPEQGYFAGDLDYLVYEAELAKGSPDCQVLLREPYGDRESSWTGLGFMRVFQGSHLEFNIEDVPTSMEYDIVIRYEPQLPGTWEEAKVILERPSPVDPTGPCGNTIPQDDIKTVSLPSGERYVVVYPPACLEKDKKYKVRIEFQRYDPLVPDTPSASVLIDSIALVPRIDSIPFFQGTPTNEYRRQEFERFRCGQAFYSVLRPAPPDVCKKYLYSIGFYVYGQGQECACDPTGSESSICSSLGGQCRCKPYVVGRRCDRCAPGFYGFGPGGCKPCDCNSVGSLDNFCDAQTGQCKCRPNTYGRQCNECQPGFWNYPTCQRCDCNGHADTCESKTGYCIDCRDFTAGPKCERCETGFYGDPRIGIDIPCRPCPCPGVQDSGLSHADSCELDPRTQNVICHCHLGYTGERCDHCANNYFGDPTVPGGECQKCECNNNIDETMPNNCDAKTGECLRCLYNTGGPHCERCIENYYGDASRQQCRECICNLLGTNREAGPCDPITGQCPCLPNVVGLQCDQCAPDHWKIASGEGCEACDCDPLGSYSTTCNEFDGQCPCKPGHGGRRCNECQTNYWGNPAERCYPCECDPRGSATLQCLRNNGTCVCQPGIAGNRCDRCARGYTGQSPYCNPCGECFDNWDLIIQDLRGRTLKIVETVRHLEMNGTPGAYPDEFQNMENKLEQVRKILNDAHFIAADIDDLTEVTDRLRDNLTESEALISQIKASLDNTTDRIFDAKINLTTLENLRNEVEQMAEDLENGLTKLKETNVEGALNLTRDAQKRSRAAESLVIGDARATVDESKRKRDETEYLLARGKIDYDQIKGDIRSSLDDLSNQIGGLENEIPEINRLVCDGTGTIDSCDSLCGGAGCNRCGGVSCNKGAVWKAENALNMSKSAESKLRKKHDEAKELKENMEDAKDAADRALDEAQKAFDSAQDVRNDTRDISDEIQVLIEQMDNFLKSGATRPAEIRTLAEQCLEKTFPFKQEEIMEIAKMIDSATSRLNNTDDILRETAEDLERAKALRDRADRAKEKADSTLETAKEVSNALAGAENAQNAAKEAIEKAKADIGTAESDLSKIIAETSVIKKLTNESKEGIKDLQDRLDPLRKKFYENERNMKTAAVEAEVAKKLAEDAEVGANRLKGTYDEAKQRLDEIEKDRGAVKDRAEGLMERARKLAEDANSKLRQLEDIDKEFHDNEMKLKNYSEILDALNDEMMDHLQVIEARTAQYRDCVV